MLPCVGLYRKTGCLPLAVQLYRQLYSRLPFAKVSLRKQTRTQIYRGRIYAVKQVFEPKAVGLFIPRASADTFSNTPLNR
jgi:hypothetical protein